MILVASGKMFGMWLGEFTICCGMCTLMLRKYVENRILKARNCISTLNILGTVLRWSAPVKGLLLTPVNRTDWEPQNYAGCYEQPKGVYDPILAPKKQQHSLTLAFAGLNASVATASTYSEPYEYPNDASRRCNIDNCSTA
jgi:hypothetical protein